jgi:hypothetical protein
MLTGATTSLAMASNHSTQVELTHYPHQPSSAAATDVEFLRHHIDHPANSEDGFSLPPTDGGKDAWLCLFACFMLEAMIWGFPSCYGVFQEYYATSDEFSGSSNIAVVGACAMVRIVASNEACSTNICYRASCTWTSLYGSSF